MNYHGRAFSGTTLRTNGVTRPAVPLHPHAFPHVEIPEARLALGRLVHPLVELVGDRVLGVAHRRGEVGEGDRFDVLAGAVPVGTDQGPAGGRLAADALPPLLHPASAPSGVAGDGWSREAAREREADAVT